MKVAIVLVAILMFWFWIIKGLIEVFDTPRQIWVDAEKSRGTAAAAILVFGVFGYLYYWISIRPYLDEMTKLNNEID